MLVRLSPASRSQVYDNKRGTSVLNGAKQISNIEATSEMEYLNGFKPLRVAVVQDHLCWSLGQLAGEGGPGCWHHGRGREAATANAALSPCHGCGDHGSNHGREREAVVATAALVPRHCRPYPARQRDREHSVLKDRQ